MVRAGNSNEIIEEVQEKSIVAIGWSKIGDLSGLDTRSSIKERYDEVYPERKEGRLNVDAGQLHRFVNVMEEGDIVLTYNKSAREYLIGRITSEYKYRPELFAERRYDYPHIREVEWEIKTYSRDDFSTPFKNTLGGTMTVFNLDDHIQEIRSALKGEEPIGVEEEEGETVPYAEEVEGKAEELISDRISEMDPRDFEELVAAVLRAMGYKTSVSKAGPDEGVDIRAHPDELGFERPLIKVQVKRRNTTVGSPQVREFVGALEEGDKGLYVSTGGYTGDAERGAKNTRKVVTLLDRDDFIQLLLENYEEIEPEYQALIPLKRIFVPTQE